MFFLFFIIWIVFNGQFTLEIALVGIAVSLLIYAFICKFMDWSLKKDKEIAEITLFMVMYFFVLLWEIIKANIATIRIIYSSKYDREPVLVTFHTTLKTPMLRVLLANSITLTPGTITVSVNEDEYVVHALDKDFAEGIEDSIFVKLLEKAERMMSKNDK